MRSSTIIAGIQRFIKKISQIKIDLHLELKITKIKKRISYLFSPRSGSGATIEVSLAFRNEVGDEEKSEENLYLKGNGKAYGKKVDLYEKVDTSESRGVRDQYLWSLQVFKNSGTVRLMSVDQGGGTTRTSLELTCTGKKFEVSEETYKEKWDLGKPVNEITFEFGECTDKSGKETCDIKIAKKNDLKNLSTSNKNLKIENPENFLYLKGLDTKTGTEVNLYKEVDTSISRVEKQYVWQITVFNSSGNIRLATVDQGGGTDHQTKEFTCEGKKSEIMTPNIGGEDWEKPVTSITFNKFQKCTESSGKKTCDIEIADNFGFKEKNFSAFRNSLGGSDTNNAASDLYLKGLNTKTGTEVNFDEDITGDHHQTSSSGHRGDKLWQLKVYKGSGNVKLHSLSGNAGRHYDDDGLTCAGTKFRIVKGTYGGDWEKSISEISFVLLDCNSLTGIGICDIRIK